MKHNPDRSVLSRKLRSAATAIGSFYAGCKEFVAAQYAYLVQKCTSIAHYALLHLKQLWLHAKRWGRMGLARLQIWRGSGKWLASFWRQSVWPWICKTARWIGYWIARGAQRAYIFYKSTALPALRVMRAKPWFRAGVTVSSLVVQLGLLAASGLAMVLATAFLYFSPRIPVADSLLQVQLPTPLKIYTADSKLIGEFGEQKRSPIQYEDLPPLLVQAFLAAEDDDFFSHAGVDIYALGRATWQLISSGGQIRSGGGTITMQVARHYLLSRDRTFYRKFREVLLAIELEQRFSKKQLMEFYLNGVFFGNRAYGIRAASQVYFDRDPKDLTLAQIALLVALPKAPSRLNPFRSPARALVRRNWVLRRMLFLGYIDQQTYDLAVATPVRLADDEYVAELDARYVAEMARIELVNRFGPQIYRNNYRAYTTIDSRMQQAAAKALANGLKEHDKRHGWRRPDSLKEYFSISSLEKIAKRDLTDFGELEQLLSQDEALEQDEGVLDLLDRLGEFPTIGNQRPLLVLLVDPAQFWALSPEARIEVFDWQEQRLSWARPRLEADGDPDVLGAQPRDFQDLLDTGDVIYADYSDTDSQPFLIQLPETEGAVVSLDPRSGAILSLQGGFSFQRSKFNRATQAKVQPGSALKPFLYLGALEFDNTPATIYDDAPVVFEDYSLEERWRPKNSSGRFLGPVRLREALVHSLNMVSIRLLESIGIEKLHTYISDTFGFAPEQMPKNLSLALGSPEISPLDLAQAYAILANGGYEIKPWLISHITDAEGQVVWRYKPTLIPEAPERVQEAGVVADARIGINGRTVALRGAHEDAKQVIDERVAFQISDMLREVMVRGTALGASIALGRPDFAGKTGTTNDAENAWFCGYNPSFVSAVWVGFDQPKSLGSSEFGATVALPIWSDFVRDISVLLPQQTPVRPLGLVAVPIDPRTGVRATPGDYTAIFELFRQEQVPEILDLEAEDTPESIF